MRWQWSRKRRRSPDQRFTRAIGHLVVQASAGTYLAAHPGADDVLTKGGSQPTGEFLNLKGIAAPLTDLRNRCGVTVSPGQLAALVESFR